MSTTTITRLCEEPGCGRPCRARGLCELHLHRTTYTLRERERIAEVLEWVMDGEPLTTPAERALHEPLAA